MDSYSCKQTIDFDDCKNLQHHNVLGTSLSWMGGKCVHGSMYPTLYKPIYLIVRVYGRIELAGPHFIFREVEFPTLH